MNTRRSKLKGGNFFWIDTTVYDFLLPAGSIGLSIYASLARYADRKTQTTFVSCRKIAKDLHLRKETVSLYLKAFIINGLIFIEGKTKGKRYKTLLNLDGLSAQFKMPEKDQLDDLKKATGRFEHSKKTSTVSPLEPYPDSLSRDYPKVSPSGDGTNAPIKISSFFSGSLKQVWDSRGKSKQI